MRSGARALVRTGGRTAGRRQSRGACRTTGGCGAPARCPGLHGACQGKHDFSIFPKGQKQFLEEAICYIAGHLCASELDVAHLVQCKLVELMTLRYAEVKGPRAPCYMPTYVCSGLAQKKQHVISMCECIQNVRGHAPRGLDDPGEMARRALTLLPGVLSALRILLPTRHTSSVLAESHLRVFGSKPVRKDWSRHTPRTIKQGIGHYR